MKRIVLIVLSCLLLSCSKNETTFTLILGEWAFVDGIVQLDSGETARYIGAELMRFEKDGTLYENYPLASGASWPSRIVYRYRFTDGGRVIDCREVGDDKTKENHKYYYIEKVSAEELVLLQDIVDIGRCTLNYQKVQ
jgi:hypothetical protein